MLRPFTRPLSRSLLRGPTATLTLTPHRLIHHTVTTETDITSRLPPSATSSTPLLVQFTATWCGPCRALSPVLEKLAAEPDLDLIKVDIDQHQKLAQQYSIRSVPTVLLVKDGHVKGQFVGVKAEAGVRKFVESFK
ncbi:thioredoxin 2 [Thecaphora frezii]